MTREEAIELRMKHIGRATKAMMPMAMLQEITGAEIDFYIATGMLQVSEALASHRSAEYRLYEAMFEHIPTLDFLPFKKLIDTAGVKIVKK